MSRTSTGGQWLECRWSIIDRPAVFASAAAMQVSDPACSSQLATDYVRSMASEPPNKEQARRPNSGRVEGVGGGRGGRRGAGIVTGQWFIYKRERQMFDPLYICQWTTVTCLAWRFIRDVATCEHAVCHQIRVSI